MASSSDKVVFGLIRRFGRLQSSTFRWSEFNFSSTLHLSPHLKILLEPVNCKETFLKLELGLHEALVNAVKHGNSEDPNKSLRIRRILTPNWLVWQIQDEGNGLPHSKRVGVLPSILGSDRGRGLFLIYQCFDDVRWSRRGNRLQLAYRRNKPLIGEGNRGLSSLL